jgi:TRAP transporter TAXI family solute receptor
MSAKAARSGGSAARLARLLALLCTIGCVVCVQPIAGEETAERVGFASLGTGELNGVYYPVGRAICEIVNRDIKRFKVRCSPEATPGSVYNVEGLGNGDLEFAIVQSDVAFAAFHGEGAFAGRPVSDLRSVLVLYPELVTIISRDDTGIRTIGDLARKRVNVGRQGSGTRATWEALEAALGWSAGERAKALELPGDMSARALCEGTIDASLLVAGHPSAAVRAQLAACASHFVEVSGPAVAALVAHAPYFREGRIPGDLYGRPQDTPSFGGSAVLMTTAAADPKAVAAMAIAIVSQVPDLKPRHPALAKLNVDEMVGGNMPIPLHPAASQAYKDLGLLK